MPLPVQSSEVAAVARASSREPVEKSRQPEKPEKLEKTSAEARSRAQLNVAIVEAAQQVSISAGNEPMALLLQTAIDRINEVLAPEFGDNALQAALSQDNTPEGTAGRIVSLSTAFFDAFKTRYADQAPDEQLQNFMATIRSGFEQGYKEAVDILKGLQVFDGEIASNIEKTYALVQQGYAEFEAAQAEALAKAGESRQA